MFVKKDNDLDPSREVKVTVRILGVTITDEVLALPLDMSLNRVRTRLQQQRQDTYHDFRFLVSHGKMAVDKEEQTSVISVLPKVFPRKKPSSHFTFPRVEYIQVRYRVKSMEADVMCAAVLFLVPEHDADHLPSDWPVCLPYQPVTHMLHMAPSSVPTVHVQALYEAASVGDAEQMRANLCQFPPGFPWDGTSPLHRSAQNGHCDVAQQLLTQFGPNIIDVMDETGKTALEMALSWRRIPMVALLITTGANVSLHQSSSTNTLLNLISKLKMQDLKKLTESLDLSTVPNVLLLKLLTKNAILGHEDEQVKRLIPILGDHLNKKDSMGWTLLHYAVTAKNLTGIQHLCANGASVTIADINGVTPWRLACQQSFPDALQYLTPKGLSDESIYLALREALDYEHWSIAEQVLLLMDRSFRLDLPTWHKIVSLSQKNFLALSRVVQACSAEDDHSYLLTPCLFQAASVGDNQTVLILSSNANIDINTQNYLGHTVLHEAVLRGHLSTVQMLLAHVDLNPNLQNWRGETALHYACRSGQTQIVEELLRTDFVDAGLQDDMGRTPFLSAIYWKRMEVVKFMVSKWKSRIELQKHDLQGKCALHFASCLSKGGILQDCLDDYAVNPTHKCSRFRPVARKMTPTNSLGQTREDIFSILPEDSGQSDICSSSKYHSECTPRPELTRCRQGKGLSKRSSAAVKLKPFVFHQKARETVAPSGGPIHVSVIEHNVDMIRAITSSAEMLQHKDHFDRSPLDLAIDLLKPESVSCLLELYKMFGVEDLLMSSWETLERCLRADPVFDAENLPARRMTVLTSLLNFGINPKHQHNDIVDLQPCPGQHNPVEVAAELGREDCLVALIDSGFSVRDGSALFAAVRSGKASLVAKLLAVGREQSESGTCWDLETMESRKCNQGSNILTVALKTPKRNVRVLSLVLWACPQLVEMGAWKLSERRVYTMKRTEGITEVTDWRGNTTLEVLMSQKLGGIDGTVAVQRQMVEELGCCLIHQMSENQTVTLETGVKVHAVCAALPLALRKRYWKIAAALIAKSSRTLWECSCSEQSSCCKEYVGMLLEDVVEQLCQPQVSKDLLMTFLSTGLLLQQEGDICEYMPNASAAAWKLVLWPKTHIGPLTVETKVVYSEEHLPQVMTPVDKVILMALIQILGEIRTKTNKTSRKGVKTARRKSQNCPARNLFKSEAPSDRPMKQSPSQGSATSPSVSQDVKVPEESEQLQGLMDSPSSPGSAIRSQVPRQPQFHPNRGSVCFTPIPSSIRSTADDTALTPSITFTPYKTTPQRRSLFRSRRRKTPNKCGQKKKSRNPKVCEIFVLAPAQLSSSEKWDKPIGNNLGLETHLSKTNCKRVLKSSFSCRLLHSISCLLLLRPNISKIILATSCKDGVSLLPTSVAHYSRLDVKEREAESLHRDIVLLASDAVLRGSTLFHEACHQGHLEVVRHLLQSAQRADLQQDIDLICYSKQLALSSRKLGKSCDNIQNVKVSVLGSAALYGNKGILDLLLQEGFLPNWGDVAMAAAASKGQGQDSPAEEIALSLLSRVSEEGVWGPAAVLCVSSDRGQSDLIEAVLQKVTLLDPAAILGDSIEAAIKANHEDTVVSMFNTVRTRWHASLDSPWMTLLLQEALYSSVSSGLQQLSLSLLEYIPIGKALSINIDDKGRHGKTVFHLAAASGQMLVVQRLIEMSHKGFPRTTANHDIEDHTDISQQTEADFMSLKEVLGTEDFAKRTPLWYAVNFQHWDIATLLLIHGSPVVPVLAQTQAGENTLEHAEAAPPAVNYLLRCAQLADTLKSTVLHGACILGETSMVKLILQGEPSLVNCLDTHKHSPLLCALINGHFETAHVLLEAGATIGGEPCVLGMLLYIISSQNGATFNARIASIPPPFLKLGSKASPNALEVRKALLFQRILQAFVKSCIQEVQKRFSTVMVQAAWTWSKPRIDVAFMKNTEFQDIVKLVIQEIEGLCEADGKLLVGLVAALPEGCHLPLLEQGLHTAAQQKISKSCNNYNLLDLLVCTSAYFGEHHITQSQITQQKLKVIFGLLRRGEWDSCIQPETVILACLKHMTGLVPDLMNAVGDEQNCSVTVQVAFTMGLVHALHHGPVEDFCAVLETLEESSIFMDHDTGEDSTSTEERLDRTTWLTVFLQLAIKWNKLEITAVLLHQGASPTARISKNILQKFGKGSPFSVMRGLREHWSAFHWACTRQDTDTLEMLKEAVSRIGTVCADKLQMQYGTQLQFLVAKHGGKPALEWLKNLGMDISGSLVLRRRLRSDNVTCMGATVVDGQSLAHTAALNGHLHIVEYLLDHWTKLKSGLPLVAKANEPNLYHYAAQMPDSTGQPLLERLTRLRFEGINAPDGQGITPVQYAHDLGNLRSLAYLLDREAKVRGTRYHHPLPGILKASLEDPHQAQHQGMPQTKQSMYHSDIFLYWTVTSRRVNLHDLFKPWRHTSGAHGDTLLHCASRYGSIRTLHLLMQILKSSGDVWGVLNQGNKKGYSALAEGLAHCQCASIRILGTLPLATRWTFAKTGENLLHLAIRTRHEATVAAFLEVTDVETQKTLMESTDVFGHTPEHYAKALGMSHVLANHMKDNWYQPSLPAPCYSLFERFTRHPTQDTKRLLLQHLYQGNLQVGLQLYHYITGVKDEEYSLLSLKELVHSAVTYCEVTVLKEFLRRLQEKSVVASVGRYKGLSLAENALLAGRRELALWLACQFPDQFIKDAGLGKHKCVLPLRVKWITGLAQPGNKSWVRSIGKPQRLRLNQADIWRSAQWNQEERKMMDELHKSLMQQNLEQVLPSTVLRQAELSVDLPACMATMEMGPLDTQILLASSLFLGRVLWHVKERGLVDEVNKIKLDCSQMPKAGQAGKDLGNVGIHQVEGGELVDSVFIEKNENGILCLVDQSDLGSGIEGQGRLLIQSAKEDVEQRVLPALKSMIKESLNMDIVVCVDWDSLLPTDYADSRQVDQCLSLITAIRYSQYAGIGAAIDTCVMYAETIKAFQGPQVVKDTLEVARHKLKPIVIQRASVSTNYIEKTSDTLPWKFDVQNGKLTTEPWCLPFWNAIWWQYLVAVNLQSAAITFQTYSMDSQRNTPVSKQRSKVRKCQPMIVVNLESLSEVTAPEHVGDILSGPLCEAVNNMATSFKRRLHMKQQIDRVEVSFCNQQDGIYIRTETPATLSMCLFMQGASSVEYDNWELVSPDFDKAFSAMEVSALLSSKEGLDARKGIVSSMEVYGTRNSKILGNHLHLQHQGEEILQGIVEISLMQMVSPVSIAKKFIARWVAGTGLRLREAVESHLYYIGTNLWLWGTLCGTKKHGANWLQVWLPFHPECEQYFEKFPKVVLKKAGPEKSSVRKLRISSGLSNDALTEAFRDGHTVCMQLAVADLPDIAAKLECSLQEVLNKVEMVSLGDDVFRVLDSSYITQLLKDIPSTIKFVWDKEGPTRVDKTEAAPENVVDFSQRTLCLRPVFMDALALDGHDKVIPRNRKTDVGQSYLDLLDGVKRKEKSLLWDDKMMKMQKGLMMLFSQQLDGLDQEFIPKIMTYNIHVVRLLPRSTREGEQPRRVKHLMKEHIRLFEEVGSALRFLATISANFKSCLQRELLDMQYVGSKCKGSRPRCPVSFNGGPLEVLLPLFEDRVHTKGSQRTPDMRTPQTVSSVIQFLNSTRPDLLGDCDLEAAIFPGACTVRDTDLHLLFFLSLESLGRTDKLLQSTVSLELRNITGNTVKITEEVGSALEVTVKVRIRDKALVLITNASYDDQNLRVTWKNAQIADFLGRHNFNTRTDLLHFEVKLNQEHIQGSPFPKTFVVQARPNQLSSPFIAVAGETFLVYVGHDEVTCLHRSRQKVRAARWASCPSQHLLQKDRDDLMEQPWHMTGPGKQVHLYYRSPLLEVDGAEEQKQTYHASYGSVEVWREAVDRHPGLYCVRVTMTESLHCLLKARCMQCNEDMWLVAPGWSKVKEVNVLVAAGRPHVKRTLILNTNGSVVETAGMPLWIKAPDEKFDFHIKIRDSYGNLIISHLDSPVFTFVNQVTGEESLICTTESSSRGVLKVIVSSVTCQAGMYFLMMDYKCLGRMSPRGEGYILKVIPGPLFLQACQATAGHASPGEVLCVTVLLKDKCSNTIVPTAAVLEHFEVFVCNTDITTMSRVDSTSNKVVYTYMVPPDFTGILQVEVTYRGVHIPNSPLPVIVSRTHSFEVRLRNFRKKLTAMKKSDGYCMLLLRRQHVLEDTLLVFAHSPSDLLYRTMRVTFAGEQGFDLGGLTKEWYHLLSKAIFDPNYAYFEEMDSGLSRPNRKSDIQPNHLAFFKLIGKVFAKAIFDGENLDVKLVKTLYKHLLNLPAQLEDLIDEDPTLHRSLKMLSDMSDPEEVSAMCLTFAINEERFGQLVNIDLKPGGNDLEVTHFNRAEYIQLYTHYSLRGSISEQLSHWKDGFNSVIPVTLLKDFDPEELEYMISGRKGVDIKLLRQYTTYMDGYKPDSKQIVWLWRLLHSWNQSEELSEQVPQFLLFVTGSTRLPAYMTDWRLIIIKLPDTDGLPTASTCFNFFKLPAYRTEKKLRDKVLKAVILGAEGFGKV